MLDRYGDLALTQINLRIQELEREDNPEALATWMQIRAAAQTLIEASEQGSPH